MCVLLALITTYDTVLYTFRNPPVVLVAVSFVVGMAQVATVLWRRSHPDAGVMINVLSQLIVYGLGLQIHNVAWLVLVYAVVVYGRESVAWGMVGLSVAVLPVISSLRAVRTDTPWYLGLIGPEAVTFVFLMVTTGAGLVVRADRTRTLSYRASTAHARQQAAITSERNRIRVDLDALIARDVRRLAACARGLRKAVQQSPAAAADTLTAIRTLACAALTTMRLLLTMLHAEPCGPRPAPPPGNRRASLRPTCSGIGMVAGLTAGVLILATAPPVPAIRDALLLPRVPIDFDSAGALALLAAQIVPFSWWRSSPVVALMITQVTTSLDTLGLGNQNDLLDWAAFILFYTVGAGARPAISAMAVVAAFAVAVSAETVVTGSGVFERTTGVNVVFFGPIVLGLWILGLLQRRASDAAVRDETAVAVATGQAALAHQRHEIARELHDVVGHHLSAVAAAAGAAHQLARTQPDRLHEAITPIETSAHAVHEALSRLTAQHHPQTGDLNTLDLARVEELAAPMRAAGLTIEVTVTGTAPAVGQEADIFARNILREALTNAVRHTDAALTQITIDHRPTSLDLTIRTYGETPSSPSAIPGGSGQGLRGMRERVDLLGGDLAVGAQPDGHWLVHARLPRQ